MFQNLNEHVTLRMINYYKLQIINKIIIIITKCGNDNWKEEWAVRVLKCWSSWDPRRIGTLNSINFLYLCVLFIFLSFILLRVFSRLHPIQKPLSLPPKQSIH